MVRFIRYIYITQIDSVNSRKIIGIYTPLFYLVAVNKITYTILLVYRVSSYHLLLSNLSNLIIT